MAKRKGITKKTRFEVFKRDSFTCQYCGRSAPDVILEVDHVHPVSKGGEDDMLNYVTSCRDCNAGKSDRELSDDSAVKKQKKALDDLQERREQISMMLEWQRGLAGLDDMQVAEAAKLWGELSVDFRLTETGLSELRRTLRKYGFGETLAAMRTSAEQYLVIAPEGSATHYTKDSADKALDYVNRICSTNRQCREKPYLRDLFYIRGIMRKRYYRITEWEALKYLEDAYELGAEIGELRRIALENTSYGGWTRDMTALLDDLACTALNDEE